MLSAPLSMLCALCNTFASIRYIKHRSTRGPCFLLVDQHISAPQKQGPPCRMLRPKGLVPSSVMEDLPIMRAPQAVKAATMGESSVTGRLSASCTAPSFQT